MEETQIVTSGVSKIDKIAQAFQITQDTIYLMGMSFILGVLFTVLMLILLDFMRRNDKEED